MEHENLNKQETANSDLGAFVSSADYLRSGGRYTTTVQLKN